LDLTAQNATGVEERTEFALKETGAQVTGTMTLPSGEMMLIGDGFRSGSTFRMSAQRRGKGGSRPVAVSGLIAEGKVEMTVRTAAGVSRKGVATQE